MAMRKTRLHVDHSYYIFVFFTLKQVCLPLDIQHAQCTCWLFILRQRASSVAIKYETPYDTNTATYLWRHRDAKQRLDSISLPPIKKPIKSWHQSWSSGRRSACLEEKKIENHLVGNVGQLALHLRRYCVVNSPKMFFVLCVQWHLFSCERGWVWGLHVR